MIVTIDGPAGSGKSTAARALAERLGFRFLDTGAMYRAVALAAVNRDLGWNEPERLADLAGQLSIEVGEDRVLLDLCARQPLPIDRLLQHPIERVAQTEKRHHDRHGDSRRADRETVPRKQPQPAEKVHAVPKLGHPPLFRIGRRIDLSP